MKIKIKIFNSIFVASLLGAYILFVYQPKILNYSNVTEKNLKQEIELELQNSESELVPNVKLIDLTKPLDSSLYKGIFCIKSAEYVVKTFLCLHHRTDLISSYIWKYGAYEGQILDKFTRFLSEHPEWLVIDLGANLGQFTLFAAKMGHKVLSVEPFHDNILRIHKASKMENTYGRITLIKNAISNKRNEIKKLDVVNDNIGAQSLFFNRNKSFEKDPNNKYLVETILLDDIVPYLPSTQSKQALLKIDIQFYEIFAFEHATNLFDTVDIRFVFMEWDIGPTLNEYENKLIALIDFFYNRNYEPFSDHDTLLAREDWKKWTSNILWKKS